MLEQKDPLDNEPFSCDESGWVGGGLGSSSKLDQFLIFFPSIIPMNSVNQSHKNTRYDMEKPTS